jgi:hypothetical protein
MTMPRGARLACAALAIVSLAIVIVAIFVDLRELAAAFVVAYTTAVSIVLGVLAMSLIAHLTTATWYRPFRARADLVIASLPVLALIGILLLLALPVLYPWVGVDTPRRAYLNAPFFVIRWIIYWAAWIGIAQSLRRARRMHAEGDIVRADRRLRRVASAGLVILGITMTFAAFDWMMSLSPDWLSTIYGVYWFAGGMVGALALLAVLAPFGGDRLGWPSPTTEEIHALGKLLVTFVLFWLYIGFAQYIVIWSGDLPNEVTWYVPRTHGGWGLVAALLVFGNFAFPFLLLLLLPVKRSRTMLAIIGSALLALHFVDMLWVVMPGLLPTRWWTVIVALAVLIALTSSTIWLLSLPRFAARAQSLRPIQFAKPPA